MPRVIAHDHHYVPPAALVWGARGLALALLAAGALWLHGHAARVGPGPMVQRIALVNPPQSSPAPEPSPTTPDRLPPDKLAPDAAQAFDSAAPAAPGEPGPLGVDSEGDAGADSFALAANPGGRELTTYPEGSGYGLGAAGSTGTGAGSGGVARLSAAFLGLYMRRVGSRLESLLARHDELRRQGWRATVAITIDAAGIVRSARVLDDGAIDPALAARLDTALIGMDTGEAPPRPQDTLRVQIRARMEQGP